MKIALRLFTALCISLSLVNLVGCSKKKLPNPAPASTSPALVYDANNHAALYPTTGMVTDVSGNLFIAKGNTITMITLAGVETVIAGKAQNGNADGNGSNASFDTPSGLAIDANHNLYVADAGNNLIRKITADGTVTTIAGSGAMGSTDGKGAAASFRFPQGIAVDNSGNIYVADTGNDLIRKITADGTVSTFAGKVEAGKTNGMGTAATLNIPQGITVDAGGTLYIADAGNNLIRKISTDGLVTTFAGSGYATSFDGTGAIAAFDFPNAITIGPNGYLYVTEAVSSQVSKITTDAKVTRLNITNVAPFGVPYIGKSGVQPQYFSIKAPNGIAFISTNNNLYVADYGNGYIREGSSQ